MTTVLVVLVSVFFGGTFIFLIVKTIFSAVKEVSKHASDNELKLKLIERGLSVQEIERLMNFDVEIDEHDLERAFRKPRPPVKF